MMNITLGTTMMLEEIVFVSTYSHISVLLYLLITLLSI